MLVLDPRGELAAISMTALTLNGEHGWTWNPAGLCGLLHPRCNPLDILRDDSTTLIPDIDFIMEGLIAVSGTGDGKYFDERSRDWTGKIILALVERDGEVSFASLSRAINAIETDPEAWGQLLERMMASRHASVRRTASEMLVKQQDTPKEFGAVLGSIYASTGFLNDPTLMASLENPDFSLSVLTQDKPVSKVFLNVPAEYLGIWAPLVRVFFTVAMLYKSRNPQTRRVLLLVDEAGQLGKFEALLRAFTYGRGMGVRAWAVFQDVGQIERNFGRPALQGFLGSAQTRQFFGVRDPDTAQMLSRMLGSETLEYNDEMAQSAARRSRRSLISSVLEGADPFDAARDYAHHAQGEQNRSKQQRLLMTPDEILRMPEDRQILFISGLNLNPIYATKFPYFSRRELAGLYLPNPYHPPADKVQTKTRWGTKWVPVITEPVPERYAAFPQHMHGSWAYLMGYRP